jgi:hypothetical protein
MSTYYLGRTPSEILGDSPQYFYALRRNKDGELFFVRSDQLVDNDTIEINAPGAPEENFEDFEPGVDYLEGIDDDHITQHKNMIYPQYRWDNRSMLYYIDNEGRLVQRINQGYDYPDGVSS